MYKLLTVTCTNYVLLHVQKSKLRYTRLTPFPAVPNSAGLRQGPHIKALQKSKN